MESKTAEYATDWILGKSRRPKRRTGSACSIPKIKPKEVPTIAAKQMSRGVLWAKWSARGGIAFGSPLTIDSTLIISMKMPSMVRSSRTK